MRILQGATAVDANEVIPNLGGLYQYPYSVLLRQDDNTNTITGTVVEAYTPFVVLGFVEKASGKYIKILSTTGDVGIVLRNARYLKKCGGENL